MSCEPQETIDESIRALEQILLSGAESVSTDGESVKYSLSQVRQTLQELRQKSACAMANGSTRPRMWRPRFGGDYA